MEKGLVFNLQRYSIHDGGGIRTIIFLKGCPFACPWCANPESRLYVRPTSWVRNGKRETIGEWYSIDDLLDEVLKDEIFFRTSGGGVTLSGGEVLVQSEFAQSMLKELKHLGIHTAIETTGSLPVDRIRSLAPYLDQVLFDFKIMDPVRSKQLIRINIPFVKENFEYLLTQMHIEVIHRIPLIPNYTVDKENLQAIIDYLKSFQIQGVHLLPFHQYGSNKYDYLGWNYDMKDVETLTQKELLEIKCLFEDQGLQANIDGLD